MKIFSITYTKISNTNVQIFFTFYSISPSPFPLPLGEKVRERGQHPIRNNYICINLFNLSAKSYRQFHCKDSALP
jgi:hypothetical protein